MFNSKKNKKAEAPESANDLPLESSTFEENEAPEETASAPKVEKLNLEDLKSVEADEIVEQIMKQILEIE